jgi:hypothetical protein
VEKEIILNQKDKEILKGLGEQIAKISALTIHKEKAILWQKLNDLEAVRPMVWINEVPWNEMNINGELNLKCQNEWARDLEDRLRKTIFQWNYFPADMVVNEYIECPLVIYGSDFGLVEDVDIVKTDDTNDIYSRHFKIQISEPSDIEKIKMPTITHFEKQTEYSFGAMKELFSDIIDVKKVGQTHIWYTPWDFLIRWWGVEEAIMDLVDRPQMVHDIYEKMVSAWMCELDQFEEKNLLSLDCNNTRIGSGGYGYTKELPSNDYNSKNILAKDMWGCANAQIFTTVSPSMHYEFAIEHDLKWLNRFGLTYYGCCEPLDKKLHIIRKIKNLRKISVSPWCDTKTIVNGISNDFVMSRKPNPAVLATDSFDAYTAEKDLTDFLDIAGKNSSTELILKDISTVRYDPKRLFEWEKIAMKVVNEY